MAATTSPRATCVNDACVLQGKPNVYRSIFRFEGMVTVFAAPEEPDTGERGPCYRACTPSRLIPGLFPAAPRAASSASSAAPVGSLSGQRDGQADPRHRPAAIGRLLTYSSLDIEFDLQGSPGSHCPLCGDHRRSRARRLRAVLRASPSSIPEPEETKQEASRADPGTAIRWRRQRRRQTRRPKPPARLCLQPDWEITPREVKSMLDKREDFYL